MEFEGLDAQEIRYTSFHTGTVADNVDPEGLGRCRLLIPGVWDVPSMWALPLGGGTKERGFFDVPEIGADVGVWFVRGDMERPFYLPGYWGKPNGNREVPSYIAALDPKVAHQIRAYETKNYILVFDDRAGSENLLIKEKQGSAFIRLTNGKIEVGGAATEHQVLGDILKAKLTSDLQNLETLCDNCAAISVPSPFGPLGPPVNAAAFVALKATSAALRGTLSQILSQICFVK